MTEAPQQPQAPQPVSQSPTQPVQPKQGNGIATAGMILGIISVATS